jgi:hypothetical protein
MSCCLTAPRPHFIIATYPTAHCLLCALPPVTCPHGPASLPHVPTISLSHISTVLLAYCHMSPFSHCLTALCPHYPTASVPSVPIFPLPHCPITVYHCLAVPYSHCLNASISKVPSAHCLSALRLNICPVASLAHVPIVRLPLTGPCAHHGPLPSLPQCPPYSTASLPPVPNVLLANSPMSPLSRGLIGLCPPTVRIPYCPMSPLSHCLTDSYPRCPTASPSRVSSNPPTL